MEGKREISPTAAELHEGVVQQWRVELGEDTEKTEKAFFELVRSEDLPTKQALAHIVDVLETRFPGIPKERWYDPHQLCAMFLQTGYASEKEALSNYRALLRFLVFLFDSSGGGVPECTGD